MKLENILIAFDGSEPSVKAFDYAVDLAHRHAAALHVLAVAQISEVPSDVETEALIEQSRRHHASLLDRLKEKTGRAGLSARFEVLVGHVPRQILDYAASHDVDMIVIGRRGHGVLDRWLLGSVSSRVVDHAQCSVTVVR